MPAVKPRRWVVLVQRRPRGPIGEAEVQALLSQGLVRTNDLAFEVSPENGKALTDWKMLWQFPEFDRRAKDGVPLKATGDSALWSSPAPDSERRTPAPTKSIEERVKEALPEELLNITPEDLIPRQGLGGPGTRLAQVEAEDLGDARSENSEGSKPMRWAGMGLGALVGLSLLVQWITAPRKSMVQVEEADRSISSPENIPSAVPKNFNRSLPGGERPRGLTTAPVTAVPVARDEEPSRRDGGNIPFDASREHGDDEMAEEDDAVAEDFSFEGSRKNVNAKKRTKKRLNSPSDESGGDEEEASIESREPAENEEID